MYECFNDKVVLITGGGSGMGAATARKLGKLGAKVAIAGIEKDLVQAVAYQIKDEGGQAIAIQADVALPGANKRMVEQTVERFGGLHYAVNNAGISGKFGSIEDIEVTEWRRVMAVDLDSIFYGMKYELPAIIASGGGAIVNIASVYANLGFRRLDAYTAAKSGVRGLTRSAALEYASKGVRINAVSPGPIWTPMADEHPAEMQQVIDRTPAGRMGQPEEVANVIVFMLSDQSSFMLGSEVLVDGGLILQ
nr:SDR family NAD(P)-dependent oxidoreductase [Sphingomonas sp. CDS-1]